MISAKINKSEYKNSEIMLRLLIVQKILNEMFFSIWERVLSVNDIFTFSIWEGFRFGYLNNRNMYIMTFPAISIQGEVFCDGEPTDYFQSG